MRCSGDVTESEDSVKERSGSLAILRDSYYVGTPLIVHWDGKFLPEIAGKEKLERLPIVVSGDGRDQLISAPKLYRGSAAAVFTIIQKGSHRISSSRMMPTSLLKDNANFLSAFLTYLFNVFLSSVAFPAS